MKILKLLTHRVTLVVLLLALQLVLLFGSVWYFKDDFVYFYIVYIIVSIMAALHIINGRSNPAYKIAWLIPVMVLPIFGTIIYLIFGRLRIRKKYQEKAKLVLQKERNAIAQTMPNLLPEDQNPDAIFQSTYIKNNGGMPMFQNTESKYLPLGEDVFASMLEELEKAEKYIFMEYFIIEEGKMWDTLLEVLARKAKEGIDVRLMYDDFGCLFTLPDGYYKKIEKMGIKCSVFNPFVPVLSSIFNNRDHRKITSIDGKVAFTGGINLADEYINEVERFGHWKDTGIVMRGDAAWGFTLMFLTLWDFQRTEERDYADYYPSFKADEKIESVGYYQPYTDMPFDNEALGENIYLNLINRAKDYVYITTPYLIIDNLLMEALCTAAKGGIDVRLQTPKIGDKWYAHALTRSNYEQLLEAGVRIFEYTPGFIHSKTFVVDDQYATVGTVNMDYRSLFLHVECGVWMYQTTAVAEVYQDFVEVEKICDEITLEKARDINWLTHLGRAVLNVFAPLM
ncbi:cardiolipin synthase [Vagococcus intermedius]|uniref:Cardiolipin synthase n=1 Tax=Vagococcus intermedius TaxID=2991418 RepID=A0AAF0I763_9ENTE|nr:cardiolipin synthase [Vagococcus intermedius]WEG73124.1 cardiolipin synthase [Vagococcus intermedius]WEG75208.1 cardiolipin synthase [Vagococcus intermedius]